MSELWQLMSTFDAMGVRFKVYPLVDSDETRRHIAGSADNTIPQGDLAIMQQYLYVGDTAYYFTHEGKYVGMVAGNEQPYYEGREQRN